MTEKIKIKKGSIEETLLLPLWGRAFETSCAKPRLLDEKALSIIDNLDYDFTDIEQTQGMSQHGWVARSLHTDRLAKNFIKEHPKATIVNIGCGLDTTFSRIDNGQIMFYELDLPEVIKLRQNFYEDNDRHKSIATSFLDTTYFKQIKVVDGLLFLAGGILYYFTQKDIKGFFLKAVDYFKECDFYFDSLSPLGMKIAKKMVLKKSNMSVSFKGDEWTVKSPRDLKKLDPRIKVLEVKPIYQGVRKGLPLFTQLSLSLSNILGVGSMIHIRISDK